MTLKELLEAGKAMLLEDETWIGLLPGTHKGRKAYWVAFQVKP